uniref:FAST kinase domains 2 n=1 Tax=Pelusios castaneus TaxID=367368 RepID=A0A8C8SZ54_9SAUR
MLAKMNSKVGYLLKTIRYLHICDSKVGTSFSTAMRTYMLGISRHKSAIQSMNLGRFLLNVSPCCLESSLRLLSQKMTDFSKNDFNAQEQNAMNTSLDEHVQSSSSALGPPKEDRSVAEENLVVVNEKSQSQKFFEDLRKCTSPCDVLDIVLKSDISYKYYSNCFTTMWGITKKMSKDQKLYERELMIAHPAFGPLSQHLMQESRNARCDELVYSLYAVLQLGVPHNTRLVQTLLRVCQERLNEFDDHCLSVVAKILAAMEQSRNVDALRAGVQLVLEQRISKIRYGLLQNIMKYIGKDAPLVLKTEFQKRTLKKLHYFHSSDVMIFTTLAAMNYCSIPILVACRNKIIENIHCIPFQQLINVLRSCRILNYHDVALYSAVANYVTSAIDTWSIQEIFLVLSAFEGVGFRAVELMDILAKKLTSNPEVLDLKAILFVLKVYSRLNHVPECQNQEFLESLNNALNIYLPEISNVHLLKAVYAFCILQYLPQPALSRLLQKDILDELKSDALNKKLNNRMLHYVNVCLELDGPSSFTKPADVFIEKPPSHLASDVSKIREALLKLLGDENKFQQNIQLPHYYEIDFKILMDADRKKVLPVTEADDLPDDSDMQRVAVLSVQVSDFCVGTSHPRGHLAMKMRHLKALGYHVILVCYNKLKKLKEEEAIEWLKGKIYSAETSCGSGVNLQDNY